jgi:hypothetical protein
MSSHDFETGALWTCGLADCALVVLRANKLRIRVASESDWARKTLQLPQRHPRSEYWLSMPVRGIVYEEYEYDFRPNLHQRNIRSLSSVG